MKARFATRSLSVVLSACLAQAALLPRFVLAQEEARAEPPIASEDHRIGPGDSLNISVEPATELSRSVTVQPDGSITMQLVGRLKVEGMTGTQLGDELERRLRRYVARPKVDVTIRQFSSRAVTIIGETEAAGGYSYQEGMRLFDLVSRSKGLTRRAAPNRVVIYRRDANGANYESAFRVNFARVLEGELDRDIDLRPGDVVYVPPTRLSKGAGWFSDNLLPWATFITALTGVLVAVN